MKKIKTLILAGMGICFLSSLLTAQPRDRNFHQKEMGKNRGGHLQFLLSARRDALQLSEEQIEKIKTLSLKMEELRVDHQNQTNVQRLEMKKLMTDRKNPDYGKIKSTLTKLSESRNEMMIQRMKHRAEFLNILTPEQKQKIQMQSQNRRPGRRTPYRRRDDRRSLPARRGIRR